MWKLNLITDNIFTIILDLNDNFCHKNKYYTIEEARMVLVICWIG